MHRSNRPALQQCACALVCCPSRYCSKRKHTDETFTVRLSFSSARILLGRSVPPEPTLQVTATPGQKPSAQAGSFTRSSLYIFRINVCWAVPKFRCELCQRTSCKVYSQRRTARPSGAAAALSRTRGRAGHKQGFALVSPVKHFVFKILCHFTSREEIISRAKIHRQLQQKWKR